MNNKGKGKNRKKKESNSHAKQNAKGEEKKWNLVYHLYSKHKSNIFATGHKDQMLRQ